MPLRLLLLDDDLAFAAEARAAFAAAGYEVEVVADGAAAAAVAAERRPDVVVVSAELPGINGFRLCSRLKRELEGLPVVLTFGEPSASSVASHQRLASRADAYVPRTVAIHELITRVRGVSPRPRSETPASSRRRSPSTTPPRARSRPPRRGEPDDLSRTPTRPIVAVPPPPRGSTAVPVPPRSGLRVGASSAAATAPATATGGPPRRPTDAEMERDALRVALEASRLDAEAQRRSAEEKARELEAGRARIARLELQIVELEREMYGASSERIDQRLLVMQRASESLRAERDDLRAALERAERSLVEERALRDDPATLEQRVAAELEQRIAAELEQQVAAALQQRVAAALDAVRREHALEMTRLRGEHAAVVFQLRHELATLRGAPARPPLPSVAPVREPSRADEAAAAASAAAAEARKAADAAADEARRESDEAMATLRDRHAREVGAMRANLEVAIRRIESLERELGEAAGSGERPSVASARPTARKRDEAGG